MKMLRIPHLHSSNSTNHANTAKEVEAVLIELSSLSEQRESVWTEQRLGHGSPVTEKGRSVSRPRIDRGQIPRKRTDHCVLIVVKWVCVHSATSAIFSSTVYTLLRAILARGCVVYDAVRKKASPSWTERLHLEEWPLHQEGHTPTARIWWAIKIYAALCLLIFW